MPTANDYRVALHARFEQAVAQGRSFEIVLSRDLYSEAGAKTEDHQMPNCCSVMMQEFRKGRTQRLEAPPAIKAHL